MRWLAGLGVVLLVNGAVVLVLRGLTPGIETVWPHTRQFLNGVQGADSWKPMEIARADAAAHGPGLYERVFFRGGTKFQYPPTSLLLFDHLSRPQLNRLSWAATALTALLGAWIFRRAVARYAPGSWPAAPASSAAAGAVALALAFTFYPTVKAYSLGQIQTWVDALFAIALLAWMRPGVTGSVAAGSGVAVGMMCLIKPTYVLLLVWGVARRQRTFVASALAVVVLLGAASLWRYGIADHVDYLRVLSFIGRHGESFYANQSPNGLMNRLLFNGANVEWQYHAFPPFRPAVFAVTIAGFLVLMAAALVLPARTRDAGGPIDLSIAMLSLTMSAPVAWEHHYGVMLPIVAACAPAIVARRPLGRWTVPLLVAGYVVSSQYLAFTNHFAASRLNIVQSYLFAGAALLLIVMYTTVFTAERR